MFNLFSKKKPTKINNYFYDQFDVWQIFNNYTSELENIALLATSPNKKENVLKMIETAKEKANADMFKRYKRLNELKDSYEL